MSRIVAGYIDMNKQVIVTLENLTHVEANEEMERIANEVPNVYQAFKGRRFKDGQVKIKTVLDVT